MLSRTELDVWRSFLRAHAHITRVLEAELLAAQRLSLASYDVLVQLSAAPGRRLRMTELADAVLLSRSGVTRLVDRLERSGLVARARVDTDGRGVVAVLTQLGFDRLRDATGAHLSGVARHFAGPLERDELAAFGRTCERLANADANTAATADQETIDPETAADVDTVTGPAAPSEQAERIDRTDRADDDPLGGNGTSPTPDPTEPDS